MSSEDNSTCMAVVESKVPFVFLIISLFAAFGIGIAKLLFNKSIHYKSTLIAIVSQCSLANWYYLLYLAEREQLWESSVVLLYGIGFVYLLNAIFFYKYWTVMREDEYYHKWRDNNVVKEAVLVFFSCVLSF